jgi:hypothetical protein
MLALFGAYTYAVRHVLIEKVVVYGHVPVEEAVLYVGTSRRLRPGRLHFTKQQTESFKT